eukprot:5875053-Prymnesium_polylepis.1
MCGPSAGSPLCTHCANKRVHVRLCAPCMASLPLASGGRNQPIISSSSCALAAAWTGSPRARGTAGRA